MRSMLACMGVTAILLLAPIAGQAASLRVAPTNIDLVAPDSSGTLTLRNEAKRKLNVQVRVFRWTQQRGVERLEPTSAVVASPPATTLSPGANYVIRVVRVSQAPAVGEESYRVIVDELPDAAQKKSGTVSLVLRYSIPVFFRSPEASQASVSWSVSGKGGSMVLTGRNAGDSRLRLSDLRLTQGGRKLAARPGLVGYVLGGATMQWPIAGKLSGGSVLLSGQGDSGSIDATVAIKGK